MVTTPSKLCREAEAVDSATMPVGVGCRIINFGCGPSPSPGCINFDGSPTVLLSKLPVPARFFGTRRDFVRAVRAQKIRYALARTLNADAASLDGFYSSHTLEHLPPRECELLLSRVLRWLKPGAVLRIALPDLHKFAGAYLANQMDADAFVRALGLAQSNFRWWSRIVGHSHHRYMYDAKSFSALLRSLGYREVAECSFGQSRLSALGRLDLKSREHESFYVEANR